MANSDSKEAELEAVLKVLNIERYSNFFQIQQAYRKLSVQCLKADDETGLVKVTAAFQKFKSRDLATLIYDFRPAADRHLDGHRNDRANVKFRAILEKYQKLSDSIPKEVLELIEAVDPISFVPVTVLSNDVQIEIPSKLVNSTPVMVPMKMPTKLDAFYKLVLWAAVDTAFSNGTSRVSKKAIETKIQELFGRSLKQSHNEPTRKCRIKGYLILNGSASWIVTQLGYDEAKKLFRHPPESQCPILMDIPSAIR